MTIDAILNKNRAANILLVEDNRGDVLLAKKAFVTAKISNNIMVAEDGEMAMAILNKHGAYTSFPTPDLILLDLNLPKMDGKEVLKSIKSDMRFKHIPVVVLTSSRAEVDVVKSYNLHANSYVVKPVNLEKFAEIVKSIESFWFTITILPDNDDVQKNS